MSALSDKIAGEHRLIWVAPEYNDRACECGLIFKMPMPLSASNVYAAHIAEVTEAAVRERVARDIAAALTIGGVTSYEGEEAARIARGGAA